MQSHHVVLASVVLLAAFACENKNATTSQQNAKDVSPEPPRLEPGISIDVVARDRNITFKFGICGTRDGEPFVDRLIVRKLRPVDEAGTVCEFESEDEDVMRGASRYGETRNGVRRCWPLTEGEYNVVAVGSGGGETRFALTKRWFGSGYGVRILERGCPQLEYSSNR